MHGIGFWSSIVPVSFVQLGICGRPVHWPGSVPRPAVARVLGIQRRGRASPRVLAQPSLPGAAKLTHQAIVESRDAKEHERPAGPRSQRDDRLHPAALTGLRGCRPLDSLAPHTLGVAGSVLDPWPVE